jgi:hypothetical protein
LVFKFKQLIVRFFNSLNNFAPCLYYYQYQHVIAMPHTISHNIIKDNGSTSNIIIEPIQTLSGNPNPGFTGVYILYKDNGKGESHLLDLQPIAPEIGDSDPIITDEANPEFLGRLTFNHRNEKWEYTGGQLSAKERDQVVEFVQNAK